MCLCVLNLVKIARALYDFQGNSKYELTFRAGEMLTVFSTVDEDGSGYVFLPKE